MKNTYHKDDLLFKNLYKWNKENNGKQLKYFGFTVFNQHQGCEVIFLINQLMNKNALITIKSSQKIKTMLINLPNEEQTFRQVSKWVIYNWNNKLQLPRNKAFNPAVHDNMRSSKQAIRVPAFSD